MSHNISFNNGKAEFAFVDSRNAIWHGLGQELTRGAPIEVWTKEAGMDWEAKESPVMYQIKSNTAGLETGEPFILGQYPYPKKKALYRSDNLKPLSIVGEDFNVVQPAEVLEFFSDLTRDHGMVLSTAGCLFDGQRFWALAETGREGEVINGDLIKAHLLFMTAVDGSMSSTAKFVSTRVVCNNTLTVALAENAKNVVRKTHKTVWDSTEAKINLGLIDSSWNSFMDNLRALSERKMDDKEVELFFRKTLFDPKKEDTDQGWGVNRRIHALVDLYHQGQGAEFSYGTAYGALNAITDLYTHGIASGRQKKADWAFQNAYYDSDKIKQQAMNDLLALC